MRTKTAFLGALFALVLTTASGFALAANDDTLRFRLSEDPETLYNIQSNSLTVDGVLGTYLLERLVYFDKEGNPQPWLAESWTISDDQLELTFVLRRGVKFHDGTDFDAAAVKFHFDSILDPTKASPQLPLVGSLQRVDVVDDHTVKMRFAKPFAAFFSNIALAAGGFNSPTAIKAGGDQYGRHPVGTGPYMIESWTPGTEIVLVRYPGYQQFRKDAVNPGAPKAAKIILSVIPEDGVAQAALETGELTASGLQSDTIERFVKDPAFKIVMDKTTQNLTFLEFNMRRKPFDDPKFRRALGYAIDRDAAVKAAWSGYASPALSPLAVGIPGFDESVAKAHGTPYDPVMAKKLLSEAGWEDHDGDGILDKDGKAAHFLIKSYAGYAHIERTLAVAQSNLTALGIEVKLETADWGAFYPSLLEDTWDMDLMRWTWNDPIVLSDLFRSPGHRAILPANPAIDDTLDRCGSTMNPTTRPQCESEAQRALLEDMTIIPILTSWDVVATQSNVRDYTIDYTGYLIPGDVWIDQ